MLSLPYTTAAEALSVLKPGDHVFIQTAAAAPQQLIRAMVDQASRLSDISIYHLHTEGAAPYASEAYKGIFNTHCFFIGANMREAVNTANADYIPVFLSEIPALFRKDIIPVNVALLQVSPPDAHGFCSLGVSVDVAPAVIDRAQYLIAQVNPNMPRTHGGGLIHTSRFHALVEVNDPIPEVHVGAANETEDKIADYVAGLVEDGATLQMGIGKIPDAVLGKLVNHKQLGIHTEMFSDGVIDLVEKGVITGELKKKHPHKIIAGFVTGTRKLYDYIHDNPLFELHDAAYVNDTYVIMQNPKVTAINSAVEIDLTGQVCADSIGSHLYSGVGGQMDFIRGASLSEGGKPIIAMPACTSHGVSKLVSTLKLGSGVVTTRAHVHYVVTEYGVANLYGKNIKQRIRELIRIAAPEHRDTLAREAFDLWKVNAG
ncbi:MAG: acetyl-CoA hydrolase/transferase family protein [Bacteroidetes bacterium]|nr:acetyl-CoA hydrolase/transferase family protein [Bacteroidota bacterium]